MVGRYFLVSVVLILFNNISPNAAQVKLTLGITSACGDTINFIANQLLPTYEQYGQFLDLELIPWGRAIVNSNNVTTCQFGVNDCWSNRMQRCVLDRLRGDQPAQVRFVACEYTRPLPGFSRGSYECAIAAGLNVVDIDYCVNNPQLDSLDEDARLASVQPVAVINFIPFIILNDDINVPVHQQAFSRLSNVICLLLANDSTTGIEGCEI